MEWRQENSASDVGYNTEDSTVELLGDQILDTSDIESSEAHIYRLCFT